MLLVLGFLCVASMADDVDDEYTRRVRALAIDDVSGHLELAKWCRSNQRWQFVAQRCQHILTLEPSHQPAKLLLETARAYLQKDQSNDPTSQKTRSAGGPRSPSTTGKALRELTKEEIQQVRRVELHHDQPERLSIRIDRKALGSFLAHVRNDPGFGYSNQDFYKLPKTEQAQLILLHGDENDKKNIQIRNDPQRLREFDRRVLPMVIQNCATSDCHGGSGGGRFRLFGGRRLKTPASYATFVALHQYKTENGSLIDRTNPADSLLLSYGLPPGPVPEKNHPIRIRAMFDNAEDREYKKMLDWLLSLDLHEPDYGFELIKP